MSTNAGLLKRLKSAPRARFYLCDLHVHSPASSDVQTGGRFDQLCQDEKQLLSLVPKELAHNPSEYEEKVRAAFPVSKYYELMLARRDAVARQESLSEGEDWALVAITDHNVCGYGAELSALAWEHRAANRLIVLPGIELDMTFPVADDVLAEAHILLVYAPGVADSDIRVAVRDLVKGNWSFGEPVQVTSLPEFISSVRNHSDYPALAIAAHVASAKGVRQAAKQKREEVAFTELQAAIARTSAELEHNPDADKPALAARLQQLKKGREKRSEQISLDVLHLVGSCGFDALQVSRKQDEVHYRRLHRFQPDFGRAVPIIASDAHRVSDVFICDNDFPYLKLPLLSASLSSEQVLSSIRHAIRYGETRFSYSTPGNVTRWISGIEISPEAPGAASFWPFTLESGSGRSFLLPLSRNLNCLIGGRGSGKSAAIEAVTFVTQPASFHGLSRKKDDDLEDWYKRARATLSGCHVRLVWQTVGGSDSLPKGALFSSRYFNPSGEHSAVTYADAEDKEILGSALSFEPPQVFRARDIENAAQPGALRNLFDRLVGDEIPKLEGTISDLQSELVKQREEMVDIARQVMSLTAEDAPLREYCRRKIAYEAANRPEVQPYYKHLDEAGAAEAIARDGKKRWDQAVADAALEKAPSRLLSALDALDKRIKDNTGATRPYCDALAKLCAKAADGKSPRDRLEDSLKLAGAEVANVASLISDAVTAATEEHKNSREALVRRGLPPGAKDRQAKKQDFEKAEEDLTAYRELMEAWQKRFQARKQQFEALELKCKERTALRTGTAARLCSQLAQDLDSSVLRIQIEVHPMEDQSVFRNWLVTNIGPCIAKSREIRIAGLLEKTIMPKDVRDSLLGERENAAQVFIVDKDKANEGRIDLKLASEIVQKCAGKVQLDAEHITMRDALTPEWVDGLPQEIREGLWTFPGVAEESDELILDAVLRLDELVFDDRPEILLNDRPQEKGSILRAIGELSPGQRCSAILPILLLNGRNPLIIDQPEDNLDNRLIRQVIVNILASIKLRRQVIIATHNPNLPVLGDVEQAVILQAIEEKQSTLESTGDLDSPETVTHLTEIMEGGREAFQYRQSIYQAHWTGPVAAVG